MPNLPAAGVLQNFYPRPPRGGRLNFSFNNSFFHKISIHALREEGDHFLPVCLRRRLISIHALREEGDSGPRCGYGRQLVFLSTPSARRATAEGEITADDYKFLSTPSARRATKSVSRQHFVHVISIHALREEGDCRTFKGCIADLISIHALREEGDSCLSVNSISSWISIHALREEGDRRTTQAISWRNSFLSTPSARRATTRSGCFSEFFKFLSTPSARRATNRRSS